MKRAISVFAVMSLTACSACSSSNTNTDGGTSGGDCKNLVLCTLLPTATVNSATGFMTNGATPSSTMPPDPSDECSYKTTDPGASVQIDRICNPNAKTSFAADSTQTLKTGGTRMAITGVGDEASYQTEPFGSTSKATFFAYKGGVYVILTFNGVTPAQDATVKAGMSSLANTIFKQ